MSKPILVAMFSRSHFFGKRRLKSDLSFANPTHFLRVTTTRELYLYMHSFLSQISFFFHIFSHELNRKRGDYI